MPNDTIHPPSGSNVSDESKDPNKIKKSPYIIFALIVVAGIGWIVFQGTNVTNQYVDALCDYVKVRHKLHCPAVIASDQVFGPGSIVHLPETEAVDQRIGLPNSSLVSKACLLNGAKLDEFRKSLPEDTPVSFDSVKFKTDKKIAIGGSLDIPKMKNLKFRAGPKWTSGTNVQLKAKRAWIRRLDEQLLRSEIESCYVRHECVQSILNLKDKVVNNVLIVEGYEYEFLSSEGRILSVEGAVKQGVIEVSGKGISELNLKNRIDAPVVVGMDFIRDDIIKAAVPCTKHIAFDIQGSSNVAFDGSNIKKTESTAAIDAAAILRLEGNEDSYPPGPPGQKYASAGLNSIATGIARVSRISKNRLKVSLDTYGTGSFINTNDGITPTSVVGSGKVRGQINVLKRYAGPGLLSVNWSVSKGPIKIRVLSPSGDDLYMNSIEGVGDFEQIVEMAGVYGVQVSAGSGFYAIGRSKSGDIQKGEVWADLVQVVNKKVK